MSKSKKNVIVTVTDAALGSIQSVADELAAVGMTVDQVLPATGVITGSCPAGKKTGLRAVTGVHSIEDEAHVQLPPPDSQIQ